MLTTTNQAEAKKRIISAFDKASESYDSSCKLQQITNRKLVASLPEQSIQPQILDLGCGTGQSSTLLRERYSGAHLFNIDIAFNMLKKSREQRRSDSSSRFICSDAESLALRSNSIDLVYSNLSLQWCLKLNDALSEVHRVLKPTGLFAFTTLGPNTFHELKSCWKETDSDHHVNSFIEEKTLVRLLESSGFERISISRQSIPIYYSELIDLMRDLKNIGANSVVNRKRRGLSGKRTLTTLISRYEKFRNQAGLLPATYDVLLVSCSGPKSKIFGIT